LQIYINGKVQAAPVYCALLKTARDIAQQFADVGSGEFYAVFSKRVWQDSERLLFDRAFAGVRVGGFVFIGLLSSCAQAAKGSHARSRTARYFLALTRGAADIADDCRMALPHARLAPSGIPWNFGPNGSKFPSRGEGCFLERPSLKVASTSSKSNRVHFRSLRSLRSQRRR
jgi:hypothetical protein